MLAKNIYPTAAYNLALTYKGQITVIKTADNKEYYGFFQGNHSSERLDTNRWLFHSFSDRMVIEVNGSDISSIELLENDRKIYYVSDVEKENNLHLSANKHTVKSNYFFTTYPCN